MLDARSNGIESTIESATTDTEAIDEVVVIGEKSLRQFRREIRAAEQRILAIYNRLNEQDELDIICRRRTPIGSQIPRKTCKARIYWTALADSAAAEDSEVSSRKPLQDVAAYTRLYYKNLLALAKQNPELVAALRQRKALATEYERRQRERKNAATTLEEQYQQQD